MSVTTLSELYTASKVRLRLRHQNPGPLNWLFVPGGPGIGADSLEELVGAANLPGRSWLVDLPGDGSNFVEGDPFRHRRSLTRNSSAIRPAAYISCQFWNWSIT